jgi:hypothetical protein
LHPGKLTADEAKRLREAFEAAYYAATGINKVDLEAARILYAIETEFAAFRGGMYDKDQMTARIKALLGI